MSTRAQCGCRAFWYASMNNFRLYIYYHTPGFANGVITSDYPEKSPHVAYVCRICVITYVHKYTDYMCAVVGLCNFKWIGTLPFCSTLNFLLFLWPRHQRRENSTWQRLLDVFSYIFIFVCLFDIWTVLLINALNAVICSSADPCLFVKWANLP